MSGASAFNQQIQAAYDRLLQIEQQISGDAAQNTLLTKAMAELSATLEELEIAAEELSQQNEELLQTRQILESERQRYQSLFAFAPDAYLVTDAEGIIQLGNRAAERLLQVRREHLVGKPLILFIAEADHQFVYAQLDEIAQVLQSRPGANPSVPSARPANPATVLLQDQEVTVQPRQQSAFPASLALSAEADYQGQVRLYWVFRDLRERKRLEAKQRETLAAFNRSEEQRRLALDLAQIGWWDWNISADQMTWSNHLFQLLGYAPNGVIPSPQTWRNRVHPEDLDWTTQALQRDLENHRSGSLEYRVIHPDGTEHWLLVRGQGIYNAAGQPVRMAGIALEITDRKRLETSQQESEARYRLLSEMSPLGIFRHDPAGRCTYVNERMLQLVDRPLEACLGLNWIETIHPDDRERVVADFQTFMAKVSTQPEAVHQMECRHLRSDGQVVWVWAQVAAERDSAGTLTGYIGTLINITERKQLESALRLSEEQLRLALDLNQIGRWDWHPPTATTHWNDQNYRLLGYEPGAVQPSYERWRSRVHPDDWPEVEQKLAEALVTQTDCEIEHRIVLPNGSLRWLFSKSRGIYNEAGYLLRMVGVAFDITERKRRETNAALLAELMVDFAELSTPAEIMQVASTKIAAYFQASRCLLVEINTALDEARVIYNWVAPGLLDLVGAYHLPNFHTADERAPLSAGYPLIIPDTAALEQTAAEGFQQLSIGALLNAPYLSAGRWKFSLCVMQTEARQWHNDEVELLQELSTRLWLRLERAHAETALRISEEQRRLALDLTGTDTWDWDLTTGELIWSENMFQLLGLTPGSEPLTYDFWRRCVVPEDLERIEAKIPLALQNQTLYTCEYRVMHPDGSIHWMLSKAQGVYDATGEAVRMVGITLEITERKQLELALQASEAKLSRILDSAIAVIVSFRVWDNYDWEYEYWSAGCEDLYGFTIAEMRADKTLWLNQVLPEDRENILMPLFEQFFTKQNTIAEYRFRRKDGLIRWICSIYAAEQIEPNCWMVTSVNYDVSDRKNLEQELLQINAELELRVRARTLELEQTMRVAEAANRAKNAFLANMSHELRTPLNAILGFSQLLGRDRDLSSSQQEQVEIINRSGEHLLKLINDILEITKIEAGQAALTLSDLDLERMLSNLNDLFRLKAEAKGIQLTFHCDMAVPRYIRVDEIKLRQVLINLLSNAIKFTQVGTVTLRVQLEDRLASRAADPPASLLLRFSVEDTGSGIDPLQQAALFQPFVQTQTGYDAQEGAGLGLSISQEFVRLLGGELNLSSNLGAGTTFFFQIPVVPLALGDFSAPAPTRQVIALAPDQPQYRILVVDSHRDNRQFLVQLLHSVGFEVQSVEDGHQAVLGWQQWQPHLIWMEMQLPVMDGYEATRRIRDSELAGETRGAPCVIIALTASASASEQEAILAMGCNDLVCKPVTASLVFDKMAEHLGVHYCYEDSTEAMLTAEPVQFNELLTALQTMPLEWLTQIQQALPLLDEEQMLRLIAQIPADKGLLAQTLKAWVDEFRFDQLIHLVDAAQLYPPTS